MPQITITDEFIPLRQFRAPRYWPTWLGIAIMWLLAQLLFPWQIRIGQFIGWLSYHFASGRRHVCEINLRMRLPEPSGREHEQRLGKTFAANGIGFVEIAIAWCGNPDRYRHRVEIHGLEYIDQALTQGKGVLLLGLHLTCFEIAGLLSSMQREVNVTYRANDKPPLFNAFIYNGRRRLYQGVYERTDTRGAMRCLKQNRVLCYAPDQDLGAQHSVFVAFFGSLTSTITAGNRIARFDESPVLFSNHNREPDYSGYEGFISDPVTLYSCGDETDDGRIVNRLVEDAIWRQPDWHLRLHKRFKTSPPDEDWNHYKR